MIYIAAVIAGIVAYLLGSINSSILVGKLFGVTDIRQHGSGNAGTTNTLRTIGAKAAALVFVGDILKGVVAVLLARLIAFLLQVDNSIAVLAAAFLVVLGHNYPLYFGFKGGKGIATSAAVILMIDPLIGICVFVFAILVMLITRYVSVGSIAAAVAFPAAVAIWHHDNIPYLVFAIAIGLLAILRHKENIKRLIKGTESKLGAKKKENV